MDAQADGAYGYCRSLKAAIDTPVAWEFSVQIQG